MAWNRMYCSSLMTGAEFAERIYVKSSLETVERRFFDFAAGLLDTAFDLIFVHDASLKG